MPQSIRIGTATARAGETAWGEIPVPDRVARQLRPPLVAVVNGTASGPTVYVGAGAHGDEFNAMEAVRRAVLRLRPEGVRGTVVFVPLQNRAAFEIPDCLAAILDRSEQAEPLASAVDSS